MSSGQKHLKIKKLLKRIRIFFSLAVTGIIFSNSAEVKSVEINVRYSPILGQPLNSAFVNTTPVSGICLSVPTICSNGRYSIDIPAGTNSAIIQANEENLRNGAMVKLSSEWRDVLVTTPSGSTKNIRFKAEAFGAKKIYGNSVFIITGTPAEGSSAPAHNLIWAPHKSWDLYAPSPCTFTYIEGHDPYSYRFLWSFPTTATCGVKSNYDLPGVRFENTFLLYKLDMPNPHEMETGVYTGQIIYTLGPGGDIDFGDKIIPGNSSVIFNFIVEVVHELNVQFPSNSNLLVLVPEGGWQQWLQRGRRPEKLFANQSFRIWSSGIFQMRLECQYQVAGQCGIQNEAGELVSVETRVTLPSGLLDQSGMAVSRYLISNSNPSVFYPAQYVEDGRAALHFEVSRESVAQMTNHAGSRYAGNVTIVWDSEI